MRAVTCGGYRGGLVLSGASERRTKQQRGRERNGSAAWDFLTG